MKIIMKFMPQAFFALPHPTQARHTISAIYSASEPHIFFGADDGIV